MLLTAERLNANILFTMEKFHSAKSSKAIGVAAIPLQRQGRG
ncbi:hypothetical protein yrohd0001_35210 [Yersinia rohdei ATCC 43380]|nr:hypothetical protein yrohd0001_35210 [Yersinia rohdei ATCC 43380]